LSAVRRIQEHNGSTVSLYGFCGDLSGSDEMKERMQNFASHHGLDVTDMVVIEANNKERSAQDLLMRYSIQLMVVLDIQRHGVARVLKGDLETDILNHTLVPILAY
jgi:hypothetical protein